MAMVALILFIGLPIALGAAPACTFYTHDSETGCMKFDLSGLPKTTYLLNDSYPEPYLISSPCEAAACTSHCAASACAACKPAAPSSGYQLEPGATSAQACGRCMGLGAAPVASAAGGSAAGGLALTTSGGFGARYLIYDFVCDAGGSRTAGPDALVGPPGKIGMHYVITWRTPLACGKPISGACPAPPPPPPSPPPPPTPPITAPPKPTAAQLRWMEDEIGAIGHFNMGTFEGCGIGADGSVTEGISLPPASTFAPTDVDPEQWIQALVSAGVKRAVLVVSHGCGFNTFPSRTNLTLADGRHFEYNYSVAHSPWMGGKGDIARLFVDACHKHGIRPGFYHGSVNNAFLNVRGAKVGPPTGIPGQAVLTEDEYYAVLLANLRQLWTDYGPLAEVWFDGGVPSGVAASLWALHQELQPDAVAFQGPNVGAQPNLIRWAGTEGGHVKYPFWTAADAGVNVSATPGQGNPNGDVFAPGEADTCFQGGSAQEEKVSAPYGGCWFYNADMHPKSLQELVSSYHDSVGKNAFWLLDWSPNQTGVLRPDHIMRYAELGNWLTECYSTSIVETKSFTTSSGVPSATLTVPAGHEVDRIVLREDLTEGQLISSFTVTSGSGEGEQPQSEVAVQGSSIGNKFIGMFEQVYKAGSQLTFQVTAGAKGMAMVSAQLYNCSREPQATGCAYHQDFAWKVCDSGNCKVLKTIAHATPAMCCAACRVDTECAVFVVSPEKTCKTMSANQGGAALKGAISGTPNR
jgi:alpha-L-fucosidase